MFRFGRETAHGFLDDGRTKGGQLGGCSGASTTGGADAEGRRVDATRRPSGGVAWGNYSWTVPVQVSPEVALCAVARMWSTPARLAMRRSTVNEPENISPNVFSRTRLTSSVSLTSVNTQAKALSLIRTTLDGSGQAPLGIRRPFQQARHRRPHTHPGGGGPAEAQRRGHSRHRHRR